MVGDRVADVLIEKGGDFNHGFTYSGHPVACAVAIANINIIKSEKLVEKVDTEPALICGEIYATRAIIRSLVASPKRAG